MWIVITGRVPDTPDSRLLVRMRGDAATQTQAVRRALQEVAPGFA